MDESSTVQVVTPGERNQIQLLLDAELDRQLAEIGQRQQNAVSRASMILAVSGLSALVSPVTTPGWQLVPATLAALSAGLSLAAIRLWKSSSAVLTRSVAVNWLSDTSSPDAVRGRLLADKFKELQSARRDLARKNDFLSGAMGFLVLTWVVSLLIALVVTPVIGA